MYKIFINKQLIYANVTIRLALFIYRYINIPVHRLSSSRAKLALEGGWARGAFKNLGLPMYFCNC